MYEIKNLALKAVILLSLGISALNFAPVNAETYSIEPTAHWNRYDRSYRNYPYRSYSYYNTRPYYYYNSYPYSNDYYYDNYSPYYDSNYYPYYYYNRPYFDSGFRGSGFRVGIGL